MARSRYHRLASAGSGVAKGVGRRLAAIAAATTAAGQLLPASVGLAAPREGFGSTSGPLSSPSAAASSSSTQNSGGLVLKVSRQSSGVALIIEGTGPSPQLVQSFSSNSWQAQLTTGAAMALQQGPQRLSLPEFGLSQVTLTGGGNSFQLDVLPAQGLPLTRPVISADGRNLIVTFAAVSQPSLQTLRPNLNQPGTVPQATYAPPLQPRAVAPPLGDMAIGTMMLSSRSFVKVSGPRITLNLRNASPIDALVSLARQGGYGFVYIDSSAKSSSASASASANANVSTNAGSGQAAGGGSATANIAIKNEGVPVTLTLTNEDFGRAFNSILIAANLQAKLEGRTIFAGPDVLMKTFGAALSKVYRLNQVSPGSAADYLANLGALVTKTQTFTSYSSGSAFNATSPVSSTSEFSSASLMGRDRSVTSYGASEGPLKGLRATTDSRLGTITLIGEPSIVAVAEQYLKQLDLRQRQVALSVKILDVTLDNNSELSNSFAFRSGSSFIYSNDGSLQATFGSLTPSGQPNPGANYPNNELLDQVRALITSGSTKILASPTLILSENPESSVGGGGESGNGSSSQASGGSNASTSSSAASTSGASIGRSAANEGYVQVGRSVVVGYTAISTQTSTTCTPEFANAGLNFGARINKIDDNGYVTFAMSPEISAQIAGGLVPNCGPFSNIASRRLDTGNLRVRDGQTLVLTGVISDEVTSIVRKWPILGDIPLIGQYFRSSGNQRRKNELIIMVTPRVLQEGDRSDPYGYGYLPFSQDGRQFMSGS